MVARDTDETETIQNNRVVPPKLVPHLLSKSPASSPGFLVISIVVGAKYSNVTPSMHQYRDLKPPRGRAAAQVKEFRPGVRNFAGAARGPTQRANPLPVF